MKASFLAFAFTVHAFYNVWRYIMRVRSTDKSHNIQLKLQSCDYLTILLLINYCSDCLDCSVNVSCHNTPPQYRNQLLQVFRPPDMTARASNCLEVASASLRL